MTSYDLTEKYIRTKRKVRKIVTYTSDDSFLRHEHERLLKYIRENSYPSLFAKAYIPRRGIYPNAKAHLYNDLFLKMDIKNFFDSIDHDKLQTQLFIELNKVSKEYVSREQCKSIVTVCSCGYPGLPLGLVTSPDLANLFLKGFDSLLYGEIKKLGLENPIYTRYADDLVISCKYFNQYQSVFKTIISDVSNLLVEFALKLNHKKTEIVDLSKTNHVRITGVSITKAEDNYRHISVGKKLKNEIFWKAINYYDDPGSASGYDISYLKGMLSFIFSIEKEGISFSYSRGMRQLIYDRGYKNLRDLVSSLPNDEQGAKHNSVKQGKKEAITIDSCRIAVNEYYRNPYGKFIITYCEYDCKTDQYYFELRVSSADTTMRAWFKSVSIESTTGIKTTNDELVDLGDFEENEYDEPTYEITKDTFPKSVLCPAKISDDMSLPQNNCCRYIHFLVAFNDWEDAGDDNPYVPKFACNYYLDTNDIDIVNGKRNSYQPSNILYVYKGIIHCHKDNHNIVSATAILHGKTDNEIHINVEYCSNCDKYLLSYSQYEHYRLIYGVLVGNLRIVTNSTFDGSYDLAEESPLHLSGYNVNQRESLSSYERHLILARVIYDRIMAKREVLGYLDYFIRFNGSKPNMNLAVSKWQEDMSFVQDYDIFTQPSVYIAKIKRY